VEPEPYKNDAVTHANHHMPFGVARSICVLLNSCSLLCYICSTHPHYLLALAASLSSLYFLVCTIAAPEPMQSMQSMENVLLRKMIQEANWRLMLNRALYSAQVQKVLLRKREAQVMRRTQSEENVKRSIKIMRKWQSWNGR